MHLPAQSAIKATGKPVASFDWTDPRTGENIKVTDFGDCRGIKKIKGFKAILSDQKKDVALTRKLEEAKIHALKPTAKKTMALWKTKSGRLHWIRNANFVEFATEQWESNGMPGELKHFIRACRRF